MRDVRPSFDDVLRAAFLVAFVSIRVRGDDCVDAVVASVEWYRRTIVLVMSIRECGVKRAHRRVGTTIRVFDCLKTSQLIAGILRRARVAPQYAALLGSKFRN